MLKRKENTSMSEPIRILHILQRMEPAGVQTLLMNIYRNIDRKKIQFDFLVHYKTPQFFDKEIEKMGGKIYRCSVREDYNLPKYIIELHESLKEHTEYHIVHGHMHSLGNIYLKAAKDNGVKIRIAHSHTNNTQTDFKKPIKVVMNKLYSKYATHLFACSDIAGKYMFKNQQFTVINNGIDSTKFKFDSRKREEIRSELELKNEKLIGMVGRFEKSKNQLFAIEVFKEFCKTDSNSKLLFVGTGSLENKIKEKVLKEGLKEKVIFLKNRRDIDKIYCAMDAFLFPSLFEGLGIVAIEAQTAGTPVICTDTLPSEINITPIIYRVSLKESAENWSKKIKEAMSNDLVHTDTTSYTIKANYDIKDISKKLEQFYLENY